MSCGYDDWPLYLRLVRAARAARKLNIDRDTFLKFADAAFRRAEGADVVRSNLTDDCNNSGDPLFSRPAPGAR